MVVVRKERTMHMEYRFIGKILKTNSIDNKGKRKKRKIKKANL